MAVKTNIKSSGAFAAGLLPVQAALATWRKGRKHREPIPQGLWLAMAPLARTHGISAVAQALGVNYTALKRQVLANSPAPPGILSQAKFVEVPIASALVGGQWLVALEDRVGLKITVPLPQGGGTTEALALARELWRARE